MACTLAGIFDRQRSTRCGSYSPLWGRNCPRCCRPCWIGRSRESCEMNNKLTVFVCGTYRDLVEEREAVLESIRKLQYQHDSMEYFGARPNMPIETCLDEVRASDVLV